MIIKVIGDDARFGESGKGKKGRGLGQSIQAGIRGGTGRERFGLSKKEVRNGRG